MDGAITNQIKIYIMSAYEGSKMQEENEMRKNRIMSKVTSAIEYVYANSTVERFKMPTDEQIINIAIIFNHGVIDKHKLSDMVSMCQFVIDRLYENGDILKPSKKE